jgi:hypothetical protein
MDRNLLVGSKIPFQVRPTFCFFLFKLIAKLCPQKGLGSKPGAALREDVARMK